jgi:hypothetical protein
MTRSQPMGGWGTSNSSPNYGNHPHPSPFEMGILWGELSTELKHQGSLLQAIAMGVERMPERLALRLSEGQKLNPSWSERFQVVRVVVPATLIASLLMTRILAPDIFVDVMQALAKLRYGGY